MSTVVASLNVVNVHDASTTVLGTGEWERKMEVSDVHAEEAGEEAPSAIAEVCSVVSEKVRSAKRA